MRVETQATHLEQMMQMHPLFECYDLTLPPVKIKKGVLKKLERGDLVLLHMKIPKLQLRKENRLKACVQLDCCGKHLLVTKTEDEKISREYHKRKKYEILICCFDNLQSRVLKKDMKIDAATVDFGYVTLYTDQKALAEGRLVWVNEEIAVEITKVKV